MITCHTSLMEIIPEAFSPLYHQAFIIVINSLDSPDNMLTNNALYPWGTSLGKDKHGLSIGLSIGSAKFKHERMQHHASLQNTSGPASCRTSSACKTWPAGYTPGRGKLCRVMQYNIIKKPHSSQERPTKILTAPLWSLSCTDSNV